MIIERYAYQELTREEVNGVRHYYAGGELLPSVTTILSSTSENHFIQEWRDSIGHEEADRITKESSDLGNQVHDNLEQFILDPKYKLHGSFMAKQLATLIIKRGLPKVEELWGVEVPLFVANLYAGTTDCVGIHQLQESIIDFKNARKFRTEEFVQDYYLQLCAYAEAHNDMYGTNIQRGVIMMGTQCGNYQEFILEGNKFKEYRNKWLDRVYQYYENINQ